MECPQPQVIGDLVDGRLPPAALADLERHLDGCGRCADLAALAVSSRGTATTMGLAAVSAISVDQILGRYVVRRWIGRGGMGDVYEGYDPQLERKVAIKLLRQRGDDVRSSQKRLQREARTLARLSHPNVVSVFDIGAYANDLFLVMELIEGPTLASWLRAEPRSLQQILDVFIAAGEGLAAAHAVGIIHRDFKPQNVLMGEDGKPRVSDFGLAGRDEPLSAVAASDGTAGARVFSLFELNREAATATVPGQLVGTPRYMAPEQFLGQAVDARSDQFGYCVALYEAVCGVHPFVDATGKTVPNSFQTWKDVTVDGRPEPPPRLDAAFRGVGTALMRGLSRNPEDRHASMRDLIGALRAAAVPRRRARLAAALVISLLAAGALTTVMVMRGHAVPKPGRSPGEEMIAVGGEYADWTETARVMATVPDVVHCLTKLPDNRTLRFVWGTPPRAEDVDVVTGRRRASPLVPMAYSDGCPELSPDGRKLIFEGRDGQGRPAIFQSPSPDGQGAAPLVGAAYHSVQSEPKWFAGGKAFVFDVDDRNAGVFELATNRARVVPFSLASREMTVTKLAYGNELLVSHSRFGDVMHIDRVSWPEMSNVARVTVDRSCAAWTMNARDPVYCADFNGVARLRLLRHQAEKLGRIPGQTFTFLSAIGRGLGLVSVRSDSDAWISGASGAPKRITNLGNVREIAPCGAKGYLGSRGDGWNPWRLFRISPTGQTEDIPTNNYAAYGPTCSRLSSDWWFLSWRTVGEPTVVNHCDDTGCSPLTNFVSKDAPFDITSLALSPDQKRLAFRAFSPRGPVVGWIPSEGGSVHILADADTACRPVWFSSNLLWVSRRRSDGIVWIQVDADTGQENGQMVPGAGTCFLNDAVDPAAPLTAPGDPRVIEQWTSEIRFISLPD